MHWGVASQGRGVDHRASGGKPVLHNHKKKMPTLRCPGWWCVTGCHNHLVQIGSSFQSQCVTWLLLWWSVSLLFPSGIFNERLQMVSVSPGIKLSPVLSSPQSLSNEINETYWRARQHKYVIMLGWKLFQVHCMFMNDSNDDFHFL